MKALLDLVRNQRGATLVIAAASMVAMLGAAALAVDVGMMMAARAASQRAADGAALAGAGWLKDFPADEPQARAKATEYAAANPVRGIAPNVLPEDIDVDLVTGRVRVRILHTAARGSAIPTAFAGVLGIGSVDVTSVAAAEAQPSGGISTAGECPLPLSMIDRFTDGAPEDNIYTGNPPDYYDPATTGFNESDFGDLYELKVDGNAGKGGPAYCEHESLDLCNAFEESWHCWYLDQESAVDPDCGGVECLGPRIYPAQSCGPGLAIGDTVVEASAAGNKQSMVHTDYNTGGVGSFYDLINNDPDNLHWDGTKNGGQGCVVSGSSNTCFDGDNLRLRDVPLVNPTTIQGNGGNNEAEIVDFMGVFVEAVSCNYDGTPASEFLGPNGNWNVYFRLVPSSGGNAEEPGEGPGGTLNTVLRLVE